MADRRGWDELRQALGHAEAGAQHRHDGRFDAGQNGRLHAGDRGRDHLARHIEFAGDFVADQERHLAQQGAEIIGRGCLITQMAEFVQHQRMIDHMEIGKFLVSAHNLTPLRPASTWRGL